MPDQCLGQSNYRISLLWKQKCEAWNRRNESISILTARVLFYTTFWYETRNRDNNAK